MTRDSKIPIFPTLNSAHHLLLHFRFISQLFVSNLSQYMFDTAIGGNFDPFVERLSPSASSTLHDGRPASFADIFELASCHSTLLDDILSAALLRSNQRGVGDLLRNALEIILEFTILIGERYRQRIEEYQVVPAMEELYARFRQKMMTLVITLFLLLV